MNDQQRPDRDIPTTNPDPAGADVDDHQVTPHPGNIGHQPTSGLDRGVDTEHLTSSSQGVKVEEAPDPARGAPTDRDGS